MARCRLTFRTLLLTFLFLFIIFVMSAFQIMYKTSFEYEDADDYIFQEVENDRYAYVDDSHNGKDLEEAVLEDSHNPNNQEGDVQWDSKNGKNQEHLHNWKNEEEDVQEDSQNGQDEEENVQEDSQNGEDEEEDIQGDSQNGEDEEEDVQGDSQNGEDEEEDVQGDSQNGEDEEEDIQADSQNGQDQDDDVQGDSHNGEDQEQIVQEKQIEEEQHQMSQEAINEEIRHPIIMWWYGFSKEKGKVLTCGDVSCFFTNDRHYFNHDMMRVFLMYGTSFNAFDLPFPRKPNHEWALMHEESPKNVYLFSHPEIMELYNLTATFKRESDFPLTTLWLDDIENIVTKEYLLPVEEKTRHLRESGLALAAYIHSDCGCPSDRDHFVDIMRQYIKVDSYGKCKHSKDLPSNLTHALRTMNSPELYRILAKYKFIITAENGVCDDYITEKFWRTFEVGSVPIFIGSKKIRDFLPDNNSAIIVDEFYSMKDLVDLMLHLNSSDEDYNKYLAYKDTGVTNTNLLNMFKMRTWGWKQGKVHYSFVKATECFVCQKIHENMDRKKRGLAPVTHRATVEHYGCPKPMTFKGEPPKDLERVENDWHADEWIRTYWRAKAFKQFWEGGIYNFNESEVVSRVLQLKKQDKDH